MSPVSVPVPPKGSGSDLSSHFASSKLANLVETGEENFSKRSVIWEYCLRKLTDCSWRMNG